jgi:hypothetical protein
VPEHDVLFGASLGQWNGADAADAPEPLAVTRGEALARWATEVVPAVRAAIAR